MDSTQTLTENRDGKIDEKSNEQAIDIAKIEAIVTPEQVHSDMVARKRRKFTKKRSSSLTKREPTPARNLDDKTTTSDDEIPEQRPKTPERRRPRRNKPLNSSETESEQGKYILKNGSSNLSRESSFRAKSSERKKSLSDMAQEEVAYFLNKTKKSITAAAARGRDRFKKNEKIKIKRSQSAPHNFTQEELTESFRKAQLLSNGLSDKPRKYSDSYVDKFSLDISLDSEPIKKNQDNVASNKSETTDFKYFKQNKPEVYGQPKRRSQFSNKIIEILDPKSLKVIARKSIIKPDFRLLDLFHVLHMYSPFQIYKSFRSYKNAMKTECRTIKVMWNKSLFQLFLIVMFCGIGGIIFKLTEGSFENYYKCGVKKVKRDFIDLLWTKSHNLREEDWKSLARMRLRMFEEEIHAAHEAGMTTYSGQRSWSFLNGVVYALTVITTIGYGNLYPTTTTGMALTIVYAIIGIPLFLIALTDFGKLFTRGIKFLWSFVRRLYYTGSCRRYRKTAHVQEIFKGAQMMYEIATFRRPSQVPDTENPQTEDDVSALPGPAISGEETPTTPAISSFEIDDEFNLPISLALFILIAYIFIGALGFCAVEKWNFFASFYFVFISMSTIGFGDYVPMNPISTIVSIVYLCFGLALMSMCINVVQDKLSDTFREASAKIGATMGIETETNSIPSVDQVEMPGVHSKDSNAEEPDPHQKDQLMVPER